MKAIWQGKSWTVLLDDETAIPFVFAPSPDDALEAVKSTPEYQQWEAQHENIS